MEKQCINVEKTALVLAGAFPQVQLSPKQTHMYDKPIKKSWTDFAKENTLSVNE